MMAGSVGHASHCPPKHLVKQAEMVGGRRTQFLNSEAGRCCRAAQKCGAEPQLCPTGKGKNFVLSQCGFCPFWTGATGGGKQPGHSSGRAADGCPTAVLAGTRPNPLTTSKLFTIKLLSNMRVYAIMSSMRDEGNVGGRPGEPGAPQTRGWRMANGEWKIQVTCPETRADRADYGGCPGWNTIKWPQRGAKGPARHRPCASAHGRWHGCRQGPIGASRPTCECFIREIREIRGPIPFVAAERAAHFAPFGGESIGSACPSITYGSNWRFRNQLQSTPIKPNQGIFL